MFVGVLCDIMDISNAVKSLDDDEKMTRILYVSSKNREVWLINESSRKDILQIALV